MPWQLGKKSKKIPCCSVTELCPTLWDLVDCSTPGLPVPHYLPGFAQVHAHWISDALQPSHPLSLSSFCLQKDSLGGWSWKQLRNAGLVAYFHLGSHFFCVKSFFYCFLQCNYHLQVINISVFVCLKKFNLPSCLKDILLGIESYTDKFFFFLLLFYFPFSTSKCCSTVFFVCFWHEIWCNTYVFASLWLTWPFSSVILQFSLNCWFWEIWWCCALV